VVGEIDYAYTHGRYARARELLERNLIASWFGLAPERFAEIVSDLSRRDEPPGALLQILALMLSKKSGGDDGSRDAVPERSLDADADADAAVVEMGGALGMDSRLIEQLRRSGDEQGVPVTSLVQLLHMFTLRLEGRPKQALRVIGTLEQHLGSMETVLDRSRGWTLFIAVQHGITAMLAGDLSAALASFALARMQRYAPEHGFLVRDACLKSAIIEVLYGDVERARALLVEAEDVIRTESWVEAANDAAQRLVETFVLSETPDDALGLLDRVPMRDFGELWPFYIVAVQQLLADAGRVEESDARFALFDTLALPRVLGEGFNGSALALCRYANALASGNLEEARENLAEADGDLVVTRLAIAVQDLLSGRPREAQQRVAGLRQETRGLRMLDVYRLSVLAGSHLALGEEEECAEVLGFVLRLPGGPRPRELAAFTSEVRAFAETRFAAWPSLPGWAERFSFDVRPVLTERELEILGELAAGRSREQIAQAEFISMNTLKTHLRSLYRKLGVRSRTGAVLEGERQGLL